MMDKDLIAELAEDFNPDLLPDGVEPNDFTFMDHNIICPGANTCTEGIYCHCL
jgi:hypothetical protein